MWRCCGVAAVAVVLVMTLAVQEAAAARILYLAPVGFKSHKNFHLAISESLVQNNHSVTLVTSFESSHAHANIREVVVKEADITKHIPNLFTTGSISFMADLYEMMVDKCFAALASEEIKALQAEKFDLVMYALFNLECLLPVVHRLQVPMILVSNNVLGSSHSDMAHNPHFSSLTASIFFGLQHPLTFTSRMISTTYDTLESWCYVSYALSPLESECRARQLCPDDMPPFAEMRLWGSLTIVNSVRTLENPTLPYTPTVVHAGGIHCRQSQPLPKDVREWVEGSGSAGFIYFSLGSVVKPSDMPEKYQSVLLKVFASLEQRVLWKWDQETMEGLPPNVRLSKWLPQQDVLGHPQLRLFLTHGGLLSLQEATYHGVPVLGFPVNVDQKHNLDNGQRNGWARVLYWEDFTITNLTRSILDTIHDSRMKDEVVRRSRVMRDQPMSPGAWTTYWVEYVIRHRGATHLRCPATQMPWYQLYNVDVWLVVVVVVTMAVLLLTYLAYKTLTCLITRCCYRRSKTKRE